MDKVAFGSQIQELLDTEKPNIAAALALIGEQLAEDAKSAVKAFSATTKTAVEHRDLLGAIACMDFFAKRTVELKGIDLAQMREVIRRSASTTEEKLMVDSIGLASASASAIVRRLSVLLALKPEVYVSSQSWGFGQVKNIDTFYGKVIIDFEGKKGHAMSLAVAGQNLEIAQEGHLMTRLMKDRAEIEKMASEHPGDLVRLTIESYGPLTIQRLQERLAAIGLVKTDDWKRFWESARRSLKADKAHPVEIPTKRTEPIRILAAEEDFGDAWLKRFSKLRDLKAIYDGTLAMLADKKGELPDSYRDAVTNRLNFALKGADKSDFPRYAQVAALMARLGLSSQADRAKQAETLTEVDEQDNFLAALKGLSARDVAATIRFILAEKPEKKAFILDHLTQLNSVALGATLGALAGDEETGAEVRKLLARQASPVPTLVVWALRNRDDAAVWKAPALNELITQAIHIVEQRLTGESLKMRNALQAFFDSAKWLEEVCKELSAFDRRVMFERIQASTANEWDAASKRNVLVRMARFDGALAKLRRTERQPQERPHLTSVRSLQAYRLAFDHLINVEIPANKKDIATARSYGDLRENAEYQFAREHERVLMGRQDEMDRTLKLLKPTDFAGVSCETAEPGTRVTIETAKGRATYTILGELDRDEQLNIISSRSRLAAALLGHKPGDKVELPAERGTESGTLVAVEPLDDAVKAWLAAIPTQYEPNA